MKYVAVHACIAAAGFCVTVAAAGSCAQAADIEARSLAIPLAGFNLAVPGDVLRLGYRIKRAATALCGPAGESLAERQAFRACKSEAESDAMAQLDRFVAAAKGDDRKVVAAR